MTLKERVILVVGGSRGIGKMIAQLSCQDGAKVVIAARSENELKAAENEIRERVPKALISHSICDVTSDQGVNALVSSTEKNIGPIYGLVLAAGIYGSLGPFDETSLADWIAGFDINVFGVARCLHAAIPFMKRRKEGRIILFSGGGQAAMPNFSAYVTSKGAIWRMTETLGAELSVHGIYLNSIAPGAVNTKFLDEVLNAGPDKIGREQYERSLKQKEDGGTAPEKAGELALYLFSEKARGLHGRMISASFDRYQDIADAAAFSKSDVYTMRRVVSSDGSTRYPKK